jgi:hypothetical protein
MWTEQLYMEESMKNPTQLRKLHSCSNIWQSVLCLGDVPVVRLTLSCWISDVADCVCQQLVKRYTVLQFIQIGVKFHLVTCKECWWEYNKRTLVLVLLKSCSSCSIDISGFFPGYKVAGVQTLPHVRMLTLWMKCVMPPHPQYLHNRMPN